MCREQQRRRYVLILWPSPTGHTWYALAQRLCPKVFPRLLASDHHVASKTAPACRLSGIGPAHSYQARFASMRSRLVTRFVWFSASTHPPARKLGRSVLPCSSPANAPYRCACQRLLAAPIAHPDQVSRMFGSDEQTDFAFCLCREGQAPPASEPTDAAFPVPTLLDQRIEHSILGSAAGIHPSPILLPLLPSAAQEHRSSTLR